MASARRLAWLEALIWTLIYGGLFALVLGLATSDADPAFGGSLTVAGSLVALVGFLLIGVRARCREAPAAGAQSAPESNRRSSE